MKASWAIRLTAIVAILAVNLPEIATLFPEDQAWLVYLAACELVKAILCATIAAWCWRFVLIRYVLIAATAWFVVQGTQEALGLNQSDQEQWEWWYLLCFVLLSAAALIRAK